MLINLNSKDESNPANFINTLSQGLIIKPNSHVCMVGAQVTRVNHLTKLSFGSTAEFYVRTSPYDVVKVDIPAGDYTVDGLASQINASFPNYSTEQVLGALIASYSVKTGRSGATGDSKFFVRIENKGWSVSLGDLQDYRNHMGYNAFYSECLVRQIHGLANPNVKPNAMNQQNTIIGGNAGIYAFAPGVTTASSTYNPQGYTIPTGQTNGDGFNVANHAMNFLNNNWMIGQPNLPGCKVLFGRALYFTADNEYGSAAYFGSPQYTNPTAQPNNCPFWVSYAADGTYTVRILNLGTGVFDELITNSPYDPGDYFVYYNTSTNAPTPIINPFANTPGLVAFKTNGLSLCYIMVFDGNPSTQYQWNSTVKKSLSPMELQYNPDFYNKNVGEFNTAWDALGTKALDRPWGCRVGAGFETQGDYADCNDNNGFQFTNTAGVASQIELQSNANSALNLTPLFQRYTTAAAPSAQADLKSTMIVSGTDGIKTANKPFMFSFYFRLVDDTAKLAGAVDQHTFLNDINDQRMVGVAPANGAAYDAELYFSDGSTYQPTLLLNGSGARINIAYATDYYMRVSYAHASTTWTVEVVDLSTGDSYSATTVAAKNLERWKSVSCADHTGGVSFAKCLNGYFGHLRLHILSDRTGLAADPFATIFNENAAYFTGSPKTMNYWWNPVEGDIVDSDPNYVNVALLHNTQTITPVFHKDTMTIGFDQEWGDFVNPTFYHASYVRNDNRITNLNAGTYTGDVVGVANVAAMNPDGTNDLVFDNIDLRGNVFNDVTNVQDDQEINPDSDPDYPILADVNDIALEDKIINVEIPNLPHRSYNGVAKTQDKTIGQIPLTGINSGKETRDNLDIVTAYPPTKTWIPLNNPGEIPLNQLQVKLSDIEGKQLTNLEIAQETNVQIEIKSRDEIF